MRKIVVMAGIAALAAGPGAQALADNHTPGEAYMADLDGAAEVPGPGDHDGTGTGSLDWNGDESKFCYALAVEAIAPATAAHLHRGGAGEAGPPVLTLDAPGSDGGSDGCVEASSALRAEIRANPAGFYFNVHNEEHPAGAIRGQLER
ncbi:MAG: CHRD domain-containing protein [Sphingomonadaceae bacterium]|nr:CHRD domain-containing protein [Sphingomonadaceae bacterium]